MNEVFEGRFGFHPCDHAGYLKLKELNKLYNQALRVAANWKRWERKAPQNRVIREKIRENGNVVGYKPAVPMSEPNWQANPFLYMRKWKSNWDKNGKYYKDGIDVQRVELKSFASVVADDYFEARHPKVSKDGVRKLAYHAYPELVELMK